MLDDDATLRSFGGGVRPAAAARPPAMPVTELTQPLAPAAAAAADQTPVVECRNVWKVFGRNAEQVVAAVRHQKLGKEEVLERYGSVTAVADVSFTVGRGEIFCIMGLSGSGKSTLIRQINRLVESTAGEILVEGRSVGALNRQDLRRLRADRIGMVFQGFALLPYRSVIDNVAFGLELRGRPKAERREVAAAALARVHLTGWEDRYPHELSGGMQQRVGLARALTCDPMILLMDEPFSALDPLIRRELQDQFLDLSSQLQKTTLFITHDLDEAIRLGHRIAIMKDGAFVQIGTPEEIVTRPADAYVARFVAGISRLHVVSARTVMFPIAAYRRALPMAAIDAMPKAAPGDDLNRLIDVMTRHGGDHVAIAEAGAIIGIVTHRSLLRGLQGRPIDDLPPH